MVQLDPVLLAILLFAASILGALSRRPMSVGRGLDGVVYTVVCNPTSKPTSVVFVTVLARCEALEPSGQEGNRNLSSPPNRSLEAEYMPQLGHRYYYTGCDMLLIATCHRSPV